MSFLAAMTLPALVVLLIVAAAVESLLVRRRRKRGEPTPRQHVAQVGFDTLGLVLAPGTKHKLEHDEYLELKRDEEGDSAPPRSRVDLDAGVARLVVPATAPAGADEPREAAAALRSPDGP